MTRAALHPLDAGMGENQSQSNLLSFGLDLASCFFKKSPRPPWWKFGLKGLKLAKTRKQLELVPWVCQPCSTTFARKLAVVPVVPLNPPYPTHMRVSLKQRERCFFFARARGCINYLGTTGTNNKNKRRGAAFCMAHQLEQGGTTGT